MAGKPRLTDEQKKQRGTLQKCRQKKTIDGPKLSLVESPAFLNERASLIFTVKVKQLISLNIMTEIDIDSLALYSHSYSLAIEAMEMLDTEGKTFDIYKGDSLVGKGISPWIKILQDAIKIANTIGRDFGFTPISRRGIIVDSKDSVKDDFSNFLNGNK